MYAPVVLGLGGTVDYEVAWSSTTLERLAVEFAIRRDELTAPTVITSERDLVRSVLSFVMTGAGGERFVTSSEIIEAFAVRFETRITLGGTCVRAGLAMDKLGVPSTVHLVSIDDHVRRLLPDGISYVCSANRDSTDPHLIVQFPEGAHVRTGEIDVRAPRANRLIYVHDLPNREMRLSDGLPAALNSADYFLISGLNSMQDAGALDTRLNQLVQHVKSMPRDALIVYEDAGFHVPEFSRLVRERFADAVDVYSMNEDELQGHIGRSVDLLDAESVAAALKELRVVIPAGTLVIHTAHWSVAVGDHAETYRAGLQGGAAAAGARYVHGDGFTEADYVAVHEGPRHDAGVALADSLHALLPGVVCCVPAFDLHAAAPTMIGLGDTFIGGFFAALVREHWATRPNEPA